METVDVYDAVAYDKGVPISAPVVTLNRINLVRAEVQRGSHVIWINT
jgi:hypothetical protein